MRHRASVYPLPLIRKASWLLTALLLIVLPACQDDTGVAKDEDFEAGAQEEMHDGMPEGMSTSDTTQLRATYDEMGQVYGQMMTAYEGMTEEMSPEARQLYGRMQEHYREVMPEGERADQHMMDGGMMHGGAMSRQMMAMHNRGAWAQQMQGLHQQMAQVHAEGGYDEMAEMHEQMTELYGEALREAPASEATRQQ